MNTTDILTIARNFGLARDAEAFGVFAASNTSKKIKEMDLLKAYAIGLRASREAA